MMSLQGRDGLGDEGGLLLNDGVIDGGAETFVEDFDAVEFGRGPGPVLVGAGDGDVEGQDLIAVPGAGSLIRAARPGPLDSLSCMVYTYIYLYDKGR